MNFTFVICFFFISAGEKPLCSIPIEDILAVEKLEEESFKMKYVSLYSNLELF